MMANPQAGEGIVKGVGGGFWKVIASLFAFFFKYWRFTITGFFVMLLFASAITQSMKEKSFYPIVYEVGGRIVSSDATLYEDVLKLKENNWKIPVTLDPNDRWIALKVVWAKIMFIMRVLACLWFIYFTIWVLYKLRELHSKDEVADNVLIAIVLFLLLGMLFSELMIPIRYANNNSFLSKETPINATYGNITFVSLDEVYTDVLLGLAPIKGVPLLIMESKNLVSKTFWEDYLPEITQGNLTGGLNGNKSNT